MLNLKLLFSLSFCSQHVFFFASSLGCNKDFLINSIGESIAKFHELRLSLLILARTFSMNPHTCVIVGNCRIVLVKCLSCLRSHCYHKNKLTQKRIYIFSKLEECRELRGNHVIVNSSTGTKFITRF